VQISRKNLLRAFEPNKHLFESIPKRMEEEMLDKQPLHHLLSVYMIKPISFDNNPFILPKAAQYTRFYGNKNFTNNNPRPHTSQAHDNDGFEMKSARKVSDVAEPVEK
jgi:hypothetical protein